MKGPELGLGELILPFPQRVVCSGLPCASSEEFLCLELKVCLYLLTIKLEEKQNAMRVQHTTDPEEDTEPLVFVCVEMKL